MSSTFRSNGTSRKANLTPDDFGLKGSRFPASVAPFVDQDYLEKLSREQLTFLSHFNEHFYGGDFRRPGGGHWPTEMRREAYRAKNAANRDTHHMLAMRGDTIYIDATPSNEDTDSPSDNHRYEIQAPEQDFHQEPAYLSSPRYKQLLQEYRATLSAFGEKKMPALTDAHLKAKAALTQFIKDKSGLAPPEESSSVEEKEVDNVFPPPKRSRSKNKKG